MPITPQEMIQIAKSKGVDTSKYEAMLGSSNQQAPQQTQSMFQAPQPSLMGNVGNLLTRLGGGKPEDSNLQNTLAKIYAQQQAKSLFPQQTPQGYIAVPDGQGGFTYQPTPGKTQIAPVGVTEVGQKTTEARGEKASAEAEAARTGNEILQGTLGKNGQPSDIPPGTTVKAGPMTIPLNPVLNESQTNAISGVQSLEPIVSKIEQSVRGGIYGQGGGIMKNIGRTMRQFGADSNIPMFTSGDPMLQSLQSDINTLKKTIPFTDGGKQLTPGEAKRVDYLLNTTGKNDEQIVNDINEAMAILRSKERLALGGRNAALQGQTNQPSKVGNGGGLDDEQAYQEYLKAIGG